LTRCSVRWKNPAEIVGEPLAWREAEGAVEDLRALHAVQPEGAEVVAELAPGDEGPYAAPEVERNGANMAVVGGMAILAHIIETKDAAIDAGLVNQIQSMTNSAGI
jgi:3-keto-L-gulonate-6-phosphate decarboxylase